MGINPNTEDSDGNSPLAIACGTGGCRSVDLLIKYGANINS